MSNNTPWPVGTEVAWYGPYDSSATRIAVVEKVYKTGHMVIRGRRFRMYLSDFAGETGDGYSKASVRPLTDERKLEIEKARKVHAARKVAAWLEKATADEIPDAALRDMVAAQERAAQMALSYKNLVMKSGDCKRCAGCGYLDDGEQQPFKHWMELPVQSAVALQMGWVKPIECPKCKGSGDEPKH